MMQKFKSRKFWMAIFAAVLPVVNSQFDIGLDTDAVIAAVAALVAFILGESHVDAKRAGGARNGVQSDYSDHGPAV